MKRRFSKDNFIQVIGQKLQEAKELLQYGPLDPTGNTQLRDEKGVMHSFSNIVTISENYYDAWLGKGRNDVIASNVAEALQQNFSDGGESYGDVSLVQTVGAIDVTIITLANSLIPFLAVDRSMNNPADTIYFANLVAINAAGGVNAGDEVMNNFAPPNPQVNLGPANATLTITVSGGVTTETFNFAEILVAGTVQMSLVRGGVTYTGQDFLKSGVVFWNGLAIPTTVNYITGTVVIASGLSNSDVITCTVLEDVSADSTGNNILKVRAEHVPTQLLSQPKQFIFEENANANMYMNKIMLQAAKAGGITDYRDLHFQRLTNMYIEDINRDLIKLIVQIGAGVQTIPLDLSTYTTGSSFAMTKDDVIAKFFIDMRSDILSRTGVGATVCITGTQGSALLESHATKWIAAPNFNTQLNGFVGTFNGVPVYRHNYLDYIQSAGYADFYMAVKLPDNSSGTLCFGEFLPLTQTSTIGNASNPIQQSTGWFSQVGSIVIQSTLVTHGQVKLGSY